jgi:predicted nucleic acid-binding Zn ribbon protein
MKKNQRPQRQKEYVQHVQELRMGSTTSPHKSPKDYRRKPKHPGRGWE